MNQTSANGKVPNIRVLVVDDSPVSIEIIRRLLATAPEIEVVGTASNGVEALELIPRVRPDVICTDLHMPKMDGLELTRVVMTQNPLPILVLSVSVRAEQEHNIFQMLEAGALDILAKPRGGLESDFGIIAHDLITKIRILSGVKVIGRRGAAGKATTQPIPTLPSLVPVTVPRIVGIGASTGGPQALEAVLKNLPPDYPLPLLCVQHIAEGFMHGLVEWLARSCRIRVSTAVEGAQPLPGNAYFPPNDRHLEIGNAGTFRCSSALPFSGHRPSVDIAFSSLARRYGASAVGVLLTGMGRDGAQGMFDIAHAGGLTIAQDEKSSVVFGMPKRAIELGAARHVLPLEQIGPALCAIGVRQAPRDQFGTT
ncbi:MAG TPA: chemotaxis-specific protein-glutamate methyltransferase CheB, partial [Burkholderiales bacterium]|nr:chemotaxis-specific protein-glutamate methyltransferase CheB [Burkholderiales bacterium]